MAVRSHIKIYRKSYLPILVVGGFGLFGLLVAQLYTRLSGAATFVASAEAEAGVLAGNVTKLTGQADASGQAAVKFGSQPQPVCVVSASQKLQDQDRSDSPETPWKRTAAEVVIYFVTGAALPEHADYIKKGAEYWGRSVCLDTRAADTCPTAANCVQVASKNAGRGDTDGEFEGREQGGYRVGGTITLYTDILNQEPPNGRLVPTVHELGHAVGLIHRLNTKSLMNETTYEKLSAVPDNIDYQNLLVIYGTKQ